MKTNKPAVYQSLSKDPCLQPSMLKSCKALSSIYFPEDTISTYKDLNSLENHQKMSFGSEIDLECHDTLDSSSVEAEMTLPLWGLKDISFLETIKEKQSAYMANPYYLDSHQPFVNPIMRTILYDWIVEVTYEFAMKRESAYLAMNYVDRLLSVVPNVKKEEYQLVGVAALYIASKVDEIFQPKITDFVKAAANGYSIQIVKQMEKLILKHLEWKIMPITTYNVINWLMNQWDSYMNFHFGSILYNNPNDFKHLPNEERLREQGKYEERFITYKLSNNLSYVRFRDIVQVLDACSLDFNNMKFSPKMIAGSLFYLMTSKFFKNSKYGLFTHNSAYQDTFSNLEYELACHTQELISVFLMSSLEINSLDEIYPAAAFLYQYIDIELTYELPVICRLQSKERIESHYEEFLTYQTHNSSSLTFVQNKLKREKMQN